MALKTLLALIVLLPVTTSHAVKFHSYINEKGETVFSNVPEECINNSALTCLEYHPVMSTGSIGPDSSVNPKNGQNQSGQPPDRSDNIRSGSSNFSDEPNTVDSGLQLDSLERIIEMNNLINEYYPAKPNPDDANKVQQQQHQILNVLDVIRNTAGEEEKPSIERAIELLRSNLVD